MRVCILTSELTSKHGWGRYSIDLIKSLLSKGVEIVIICRKEAKNNSQFKTINILPNPLDLFQNYFLAYFYARRLKNILKECDLLHSFIEPYSYITYLLSKMTDKDYFITAHGTYGLLPFYYPFYKRYFHKKSFQNAKKIICVSHYTKDRLAKYGLNNLEVINNGINFEKFYKPPIPSFGERKNIILSVGALKFRKRFHVSIPAFAIAKRKLPNLRYKIVGDCSDRNYFKLLKDLSKKYGVEKDIDFLSGLSDKELVGLYQTAKLFILTSVNADHHFEGFGLVYLEAGACGLPVIGSRDSGAEDAIQHGKTGFLVEQENPETVACAIIKILENKKLAEQMGKNGVIWAKQHDWNHIVKEYLKIYLKNN